METEIPLTVTEQCQPSKASKTPPKKPKYKKEEIIINMPKNHIHGRCVKNQVPSIYFEPLPTNVPYSNRDATRQRIMQQYFNQQDAFIPKNKDAHHIKKNGKGSTASSPYSSPFNNHNSFFQTNNTTPYEKKANYSRDYSDRFHDQPPPKAHSFFHSKGQQTPPTSFTSQAYQTAPPHQYSMPSPLFYPQQPSQDQPDYDHEGSLMHWPATSVRIRKTVIQVVFRNPLQLSRDQLVIPFENTKFITKALKKYVAPHEDLGQIRNFIDSSKVANGKICLVRTIRLNQFRALCFAKLPESVPASTLQGHHPETAKYNQFSHIENCLLNAVKGVQECGDSTLVIPFMGSGRISVTEAAEVMIKALVRYFMARPSVVKEVTMCSEEAEEYIGMAKVLRNHLDEDVIAGKVQ